MDYSIGDRFPILLDKVGTRRIKSIYSLKRGEVEIIYHLFTSLFHFFLIFLRDLKIFINQDQSILFDFKRLLKRSSYSHLWHSDCSLYNHYERNS